ncbi:zinc ribbon domain-containing protein [Streptomyces armeniacus]|uniref:Zinc ribbon domain-containing protein n=1 Tax=Streptomyces armeniacus TaxID=83291 RepID=A0A345XIX2_9ACTN|nr:zinc ribbon domain-containing protein [Streptomyces armeniacus]AXK31588.1 zinc ribbon domain-containing protein [Streptomyces armeniacus]
MSGTTAPYAAPAAWDNTGRVAAVTGAARGIVMEAGGPGGAACGGWCAGAC